MSIVYYPRATAAAYAAHVFSGNTRTLQVYIRTLRVQCIMDKMVYNNNNNNNSFKLLHAAVSRTLLLVNFGKRKNEK